MREKTCANDRCRWAGAGLAQEKNRAHLMLTPWFFQTLVVAPVVEFKSFCG